MRKVLLALVVALVLGAQPAAAAENKRVAEVLGTFTANGSLVLRDRVDVTFFLDFVSGTGTVSLTCRLAPNTAAFTPDLVPIDIFAAATDYSYPETDGDEVLGLPFDCYEWIFTMASCASCNVTITTYSRENRR